MPIHATVSLYRNQFVAVLSDGWCIERPDFQSMALALVHAGVHASDVQFEWKVGQRMITAGQKIGMCSKMRELEREINSLLTAA